MGNITSKLFTKKNTKSSVMKFETSQLLKLKKKLEKSPSGSEKIALLQELQQLQARLKQRPGKPTGAKRQKRGESPDFYTSWKVARCFYMNFLGSYSSYMMSTLCKCILYTCTQPQRSFKKKYIYIYMYPPLILVFYIELGSHYCLKCLCVGNLGQPPPDAGGFCVPPLVNEWYIIQYTNCTISVCNQTHIENPKNTENTQKPNSKTLFPPPLFFVAIG